MKKFVYYEIAGFLPSSFVSHRLGHDLRYSSKEKAIEQLERVIEEWRTQNSFCCGGTLIDENCRDDFGYQHQFVFKGRRTGMVTEITYRVIEHKIWYND